MWTISRQAACRSKYFRHSIEVGIRRSFHTCIGLRIRDPEMAFSDLMKWEPRPTLPDVRKWQQTRGNDSKRVTTFQQNVS